MDDEDEQQRMAMRLPSETLLELENVSNKKKLKNMKINYSSDLQCINICFSNSNPSC